MGANGVDGGVLNGGGQGAGGDTKVQKRSTCLLLGGKSLQLKLKKGRGKMHASYTS